MDENFQEVHLTDGVARSTELSFCLETLRLHQNSLNPGLSSLKRAKVLFRSSQLDCLACNFAFFLPM